MKKQALFYTVTAAALLTFFQSPVAAQSVMEKTVQQRNDLIRYLRAMRPMAFNFACDPVPECINSVPEAERKNEPWERIKKYNEAKKIYQEGLIYLYEKDYINAYNRFLDAQTRVEHILEDLSQAYIDRTEIMLRDSIEVKDPEAGDLDLSVVDISMEYGPKTQKRRDFQIPREAGIEDRRYHPKTHRFAKNKYHIEENMKKGYEHLFLAKEARTKGLNAGVNLPTHRDERVVARRKKIEHFLDSIRMARLAKFNAEKIYHLKYPFDNYALQSPFNKTEHDKRNNKQGQDPVIDGFLMEWHKHPYLLPKNLHPIFNLSIPEKYRIDVVDIRDWRYDDERNVFLEFKYQKVAPLPVQKVGAGNPPAAQP